MLLSFKATETSEL